MSPFEFDSRLERACLKLRVSANKGGQCMNHAHDALERSLEANQKAILRLQASSQRLSNCMRAQGL